MSSQTAETGNERGGEDRIEAIRATLEAAIMKGALRPGMKLREEVIADHFGVSRTVARGGLAILQRERLVDRRRNHGAFVASPEADEARHLLEARRAVELATARQAAENATAATIKRLERVIAEEDKMREDRALDGADELVWGNFHLELAEAAGNPVLTMFLRNIVARVSLVSALYEDPNARRCGPDHHRKIVDALRTGNSEAAVATMAAHLDEMEAGMNLSGPADDQLSLASVLQRFAPAGK